MKFLKALNNPFVLGLQGFVAGAILVLSTTSGDASAAPQVAEPEIAALTGIPR
jgi:hypothetical protein